MKLPCPLMVINAGSAANSTVALIQR